MREIDFGMFPQIGDGENTFDPIAEQTGQCYFAKTRQHRIPPKFGGGTPDSPQVKIPGKKHNWDTGPGRNDIRNRPTTSNDPGGPWTKRNEDSSGR